MPPTGNVTTFVGRTTSEGGNDLMMLWNPFYRKFIAVEAIGFSPILEPDYLEHRSTNAWLEKVQNLLDTIDFESDNMWAYMIDRPSGRRIIQRPMERYRIPCDFLWAPRVDLSEIEITGLWFCAEGHGRGYWKGKEVDIQLASDDLSLRVIERETRGLKAVRGMNISYEVVAHIFVGDLLCGILTESSSSSRPVRVTDRAIVFAALAKLERSFMLHGYLVDPWRMAIDGNGQFRLLSLHALRYYAPHQQKLLEKDAQTDHWGNIRTLFDWIAMYPPQFKKVASTVLARTPSPLRLLAIPIRFDVGLRDHFAQDENVNRHRKKSSKTTRGNPKALAMGTLPPDPKGPKAHNSVLAKTSRHIEADAPPPYTELPPRVVSITARPRVPLAPEFGGASIVEVE
ncbi:hypothetical protein B0H14DRAFT_3144415 [Mycena olivaceomarginata]|nr:hypothetical protein B0H14DRAFT_3144415 [Mycena olivaceomarginata]